MNNLEIWEKVTESSMIVNPHPRMKVAFDAFDKLRFESRRLRSLSKKEFNISPALSCLGMFASAGCGKTTIINAYMNKVDDEPKASDLRPVVRVNLSTNVTVKGFYQDVLIAFGDPNFSRGTQHQLEQRVYHFLNQCGVELLIIDEVHHLIHSETKKVRWDVAELFKNMLNAKVCSIVLSGIEKAKCLLIEDTQLARRASPPVQLDALRPEFAEERNFFAAFLGKFDEELVRLKITKSKSGFLEGQLPGAFMQASGGVIGTVAKIIQYALDSSLRRGASSIELCDLIRATDTWAVKLGLVSENPFSELSEISE